MARYAAGFSGLESFSPSHLSPLSTSLSLSLSLSRSLSPSPFLCLRCPLSLASILARFSLSLYRSMSHGEARRSARRGRQRGENKSFAVVPRRGKRSASSRSLAEIALAGASLLACNGGMTRRGRHERSRPAIASLYSIGPARRAAINCSLVPIRANRTESNPRLKRRGQENRETKMSGAGTRSRYK